MTLEKTIFSTQLYAIICRYIHQNWYMKKLFIMRIVSLVVLVSILSCKKQYPTAYETPPGIERKIRFQLYTNQDFSGNTSIINFSLFIKNGNTNLFDSALAVMKIKDIPDAAHKIVIEKTVTTNGNSDLAAGFRYEIQDVGNSWYIDTSKAGNPFKIIDYAFQ